MDYSYKRLVDRDVAICCVSPKDMIKVYNFLRYKGFNRTIYWDMDYFHRHFLENYCFVLNRDTIVSCTYGACKADALEIITDIQFLKYNSLSFWDKFKKYPIGFIDAAQEKQIIERQKNN